MINPEQKAQHARGGVTHRGRNYARPELKVLGSVAVLTTSSSNWRHPENTGADEKNNATRNRP